MPIPETISLTRDAVYGFRNLVDRLLRLTVMDERCFVRPIVNPAQPSVFILAGPAGVSDPLRLTNGYHLRLIIDLTWGPESEVIM
jgi:hypothetical protein